MNTIARNFNLGVSLILELFLLAATCYWGFRTGESTWAKWTIGIGAPALVIGFWGSFLAPTARRRMSMLPGSIASLSLFLGACALTAGMNHTVPAAVIAVISVVNFTFKLVWKQW